MIKILLSYSDSEKLEKIRSELNGLGYDVIVTSNSYEKIFESLNKNLPNLLITDISLNKYGKNILKDDVSSKYNIPVLFLTNSISDDLLKENHLSNLYDCIVQPFEKDNLRAAIEVIIYKKKIESKVEESERWLMTTLKCIGDAVIATDNDQNVKFANPLAEMLTEFDADEMIGKKVDHVYNTMLDISDEGLICNYSEYYHRDKITTSVKNKQLITKNGNIIPIEENMTAIKGNDGKVIGEVYVFKDISKRRLFESELLKSRNFYLSLFEKFPVLIWRTNQGARFDYFNDTWLRFTGRKIEDEINEGWLNYIHEDEREKFKEDFKKAFVERDKFEMRFRLQNKRDEYVELICIATPFNDFKGKFVGYLGVCYKVEAG
ncbi:MAG: PAS domain S-box protein [Melioribacteraceae bacterium]|nr:PAS domain S-box protein [Melioribacteraceae bacterium]